MPRQAAGGQLRREPARGGGLFGRVPRCSLRRLRGEGWSRWDGGGRPTPPGCPGPAVGPWGQVQGAPGASVRGMREALGSLFTVARGGGEKSAFVAGKVGACLGRQQERGEGGRSVLGRGAGGMATTLGSPPPAHAGPGTIAGTSPFPVSWPHTLSNRGVRGGGCPASAPAFGGAGSGLPGDGAAVPRPL